VGLVGIHIPLLGASICSPCVCLLPAALQTLTNTPPFKVVEVPVPGIPGATHQVCACPLQSILCPTQPLFFTADVAHQCPDPSALPAATCRCCERGRPSGTLPTMLYMKYVTHQWSSLALVILTCLSRDPRCRPTFQLISTTLDHLAAAANPSKPSPVAQPGTGMGSAGVSGPTAYPAAAPAPSCACPKSCASCVTSTTSSRAGTNSASTRPTDAG
jgi:hypothetical protein